MEAGGEAGRLQELIQLHSYLKTEHKFTSGEINDLLKFADPLAVAHHCLKVNKDPQRFPISDLINRYQLHELYQPAAQRRPSLREQLTEAQKEIHQNLRLRNQNAHSYQQVL